MKNFPPDVDYSPDIHHRGSVASALPAKDSLVTNIIEKMFILCVQEGSYIIVIINRI